MKTGNQPRITVHAPHVAGVSDADIRAAVARTIEAVGLPPDVRISMTKRGTDPNDFAP